MFVLKINSVFTPRRHSQSPLLATITDVSWFHDYFAWQHIAPVGKTARHLSSPEASRRATHLEAQNDHFNDIKRVHFWLEIMVDILGEMWGKVWIKCQFLSQLQVTPANQGASSLLRSVSITKSSGMRSLSCLHGWGISTFSLAVRDVSMIKRTLE